MTHTELRERLIKDLERYKNFGTPFTPDMADHLLHLIDEYVKGLIPEFTRPRGFYETALEKGHNQATNEIRRRAGIGEK